MSIKKLVLLSSAAAVSAVLALGVTGCVEKDPVTEVVYYTPKISKYPLASTGTLGFDRGSGTYTAGATFAVTATDNQVDTAYKFQYWSRTAGKKKADGSWLSEVEISGPKVTIKIGEGDEELAVVAYFKQTKKLDGPVYVDDRDNNKSYSVVQIGDQLWMTKNMDLNMPEVSWCYGGDDANCGIYGRIYNLNGANNVCQTTVGWRLPSNRDWNDLLQTVGGSESMATNRRVAADVLSAGTGWKSEGNGTDLYGFAALPGGLRDAVGGFQYEGDRGFWWSSTTSGTSAFVRRIIANQHDDSMEDTWVGEGGYNYSVRCVKNL